ncbi:hypothetical protein HO929_01035 [Streptococcus suis]|uniref:hypothetical protein n=1 Tax=Streptococcus suis TaxID=1307 RepID=UPI0005CCDAF7|nr:hypothetical protein [Streptococcus suis]NQH30833.1 hypothetical protein [Streptococcus suis]NQI17276.1 hypothetical protein [Streptococcus suis]NQO90905.1 hypothetical protein [Streptococcus suis]NQP00151.1 hypothetical protein [Streptococcus suis]NQP28577.1 hypothetical protein [Streptococcus suis]
MDIISDIFHAIGDTFILRSHFVNISYGEPPTVGFLIGIIIKHAFAPVFILFFLLPKRRGELPAIIKKVKQVFQELRFDVMMYVILFICILLGFVAVYDIKRTFSAHAYFFQHPVVKSKQGVLSHFYIKKGGSRASHADIYCYLTIDNEHIPVYFSDGNKRIANAILKDGKDYYQVRVGLDNDGKAVSVNEFINN